MVPATGSRGGSWVNNRIRLLRAAGFEAERRGLVTSVEETHRSFAGFHAFRTFPGLYLAVGATPSGTLSRNGHVPVTFLEEGSTFLMDGFLVRTFFASYANQPPALAVVLALIGDLIDKMQVDNTAFSKIDHGFLKVKFNLRVQSTPRSNSETTAKGGV